MKAFKPIVSIRDAVGHSARVTFPFPGRKKGTTLVAVMLLLAFLVTGLGAYLYSLKGIRGVQEQRMMDDRAQMAAEAGLAKAMSKFWVMTAPPTTNTVWNMNVSSADFWPYQTVTVNVVPSIVGGQQGWTLASTATADPSDRRHASIARRVQATFTSQNFARYEYFVNNYGGVWVPGYYQFEGFGEVILGPYHANTGIAFWPNMWINKEMTSGASGVDVTPLFWARRRVSLGNRKRPRL